MRVKCGRTSARENTIHFPSAFPLVVTAAAAAAAVKAAATLRYSLRSRWLLCHRQDDGKLAPRRRKQHVGVNVDCIFLIISGRSNDTVNIISFEKKLGASRPCKNELSKHLTMS